MEKGIVQRSYILGILGHFSSDNSVGILLCFGKCLLFVTFFVDAIEQFDFVHRSFGIMLGRLLHLHGKELLLLTALNRFPIFHHPYGRKMTPAQFLDDDISEQQVKEETKL
jgi:hypothetical protein